MVNDDVNGWSGILASRGIEGLKSETNVYRPTSKYLVEKAISYAR